MAQITIGQYYPQNSIIHKLDPRVKLFGTIVFIVLLFNIKSIIGYGLISLYIVTVVCVSKVPFKKLLKGLRGILFIMLLSIFINVLYTPGDVMISFWVFNITKEGLLNGGLMALRLIYMIVGTSIMTLTTTPNNISDGLEKGLSFLKIIKIPVHDLAMIISLALRFVPTLMEETEKITKAQKARGAHFDTGNILQRAKSLLPILIPLLITSIRKALDLATAMEARCYHGGNRTKMKPLIYERRDVVAYIAILFMVLSIVLTNILTINIDSLNLLIVK